ncbi:hypothetical protein HX882_20930 [Pseudomonas gingeri]|uniref:Lipoprotein n=1 Tax=Pseudomonas gingeri TaxID=117681 RepID=A0A7Y7XET8_9PSED|nr:hypothetical protein [Pseudomonas gingeri]NWB98366.1 hypothetical protein [Pseudomonas gingeri]
MYRKDKCGWTCALLVGAVTLGGCTSLLHGKQYQFPQPGEPAATVRLEYDRNANLDAMTFNDSGCYAGSTALPHVGGVIEAPVAAGNELVLTYRQQAVDGVCQIPFSFTPQEGATYTLKSGSWSKPKAGILPIFNSDEHYCGLGVVKKIGTQVSIEPVQQLRIKTGFGCLRFVKK